MKGLLVKGSKMVFMSKLIPPLFKSTEVDYFLKITEIRQDLHVLDLEAFKVEILNIFNFLERVGLAN